MEWHEQFICQVAKPEDAESIVHLWQNVFGDETEFIKQCLPVFAGWNNILLAKTQKNVLAAMLLMPPCYIGKQKGVYLYALATSPQFRNKGIMGSLMAKSEAIAIRRGASFSVLIPASGPLYAFYQKRGYAHTLHFKSLQVQNIKSQNTGQIICKQLLPQQFILARKHILKGPAILFKGQRQNFVAQELAQEGFLLAKAKEAYAVCKPQGENLFVGEFAAKTDEDAILFLAQILKKTHCTKATITLPMWAKIFEKEAQIKPAAMLKSLSSKFVFNQDTYLRFALDDAKDMP